MSAARDVATSWAQAWQLPAAPRVALMAAAEDAAQRAAARAIDLARDAVDAADDDKLGLAIALIHTAGCETSEVLAVGWPWIHAHRCPTWPDG